MPTTPTKLHPFPKVVVTPVAAAHAHFKNEEQNQSTITQCYRGDTVCAGKPPLSSSSSDSSSDDTDFEHKKIHKKKNNNSPRKNVTTIKTEKRIYQDW